MEINLHQNGALWAKESKHLVHFAITLGKQYLKMYVSLRLLARKNLLSFPLPFSFLERRAE